MDAPQKQENQQQKSKPSTNKNQGNIIGFAVLGLGVLAILFVGYAAYQKNMGSEDKTSQSDVEAFQQAGKQRQTRPVNRAAGEKPQRTHKRQKKITEKEIGQTWESHLEKGRALLEVGKGKYRYIFIPNSQSTIRYFSSGAYTLQDDIMMLKPDLSMKAPVSKTYEYKVLTRSEMPVMVSKHQEKMIWQVPSQDVSIYVPPHHPILSTVKNKIVVWNILE